MAGLGHRPAVAQREADDGGEVVELRDPPVDDDAVGVLAVVVVGGGRADEGIRVGEMAIGEESDGHRDLASLHGQGRGGAARVTKLEHLERGAGAGVRAGASLQVLEREEVKVRPELQGLPEQHVRVGGRVALVAREQDRIVVRLPALARAEPLEEKMLGDRGTSGKGGAEEGEERDRCRGDGGARSRASVG